MASSTSHAAVADETASRIMIALDVSSADEARRVAEELAGYNVIYKIGLQLFSSAGRDIVEEFVGKGHRVFLDLKFHDIPNTVAQASIAASRLGVWMFNVHSLGGGSMLRAARYAVDNEHAVNGTKRPLIVAVTVLTSSAEATLHEVGFNSTPKEQVLRLARLAKLSEMDGVVASAQEVPMIKAEAGGDFLTVTPGIRPNSATKDDQERVMTVQGALSNGSDFLVIGRPVLEAEDRRSAFESMLNAGDAE
ncbi:MAG: orotidine-5'-phosphate decarboxylase [Acidobacteriota bacterium]|nr:MAG: orotidine-5'-phosphate decarboxylase [Acidobacteriota bacterium]